MNIYGLPKTAEIGGREYPINTDYRDVLDIISHLTDVDKPQYIRWQVAIGLFFEGSIPEVHQHEAMKYLSEFISYGETEAHPGPKLMDWDQDAQIIISDINKVAGMEVRAVKYMHWWTFLSYFCGIGEGQLSTVISIRAKKAGGKKLEKWEEEFYKKNKSKIDLRTKNKQGDAAVQEYFRKWL